jgi:hypothetical protein
MSSAPLLACESAMFSKISVGLYQTTRHHILYFGTLIISHLAGTVVREELPSNRTLFFIPIGHSSAHTTLGGSLYRQV